MEVTDKSRKGVLAELVGSGAEILLWRAGALIFTMISTIWTARCLGPFKTGISGSIITGVGQIALLASLPTGNYLVRRYKEEAANDSKLALVSVGVKGRVWCSVIAMLVASVVALVIGVPNSWRISVLAGIPLIAVTTINVSWLLQAQEKQTAQYRSGCIVAIVGAVGTFAIIRADSTAGLDVLVALLSNGVGAVVIWKMSGTPGFWRMVTFTKIVQCCREMKRGLWLYMTAIVIYIYIGLEVPLVGYLVSVTDLGLYRAAFNSAAAANSLLVLIPTILYPRFIDLRLSNPRELWRLQKYLALLFSVVGCFVAIIVFVTSPLLFTSIYGVAYSSAARPFSLLIIGKIIVVINGVFSCGLWSCKRDKEMFWMMTGTAGVSILLNITLIPRFGMSAAALVNIVSELIILSGTVYLSVKINRCQ